MLPSLFELVNLHRRSLACEYWSSLLSDSSSSRVSRTSQFSSTIFFHIYLYVYTLNMPLESMIISYLLDSHLSWAKSRHFSVSSPFFQKRFVHFFDITQPRRAAFSLKKSIFPWVLPKKACQNIVFWFRLPKKKS